MNTKTFESITNRLTSLEKVSPIDRAELLRQRSQDSLIHRDGVIKSNSGKGNAAGFSVGATELAMAALRGKSPKNRIITNIDTIKDIDRSPISISTTRALIWASPVTLKKIAVQWHVPQNIRRNCKDLLLDGDNSAFVLRIYQEISAHSGWKASHRTLEFDVDVSKRKCYINLDNPGGDFTAELGVRCGNGRFVFLTRSKPCTASRLLPVNEHIPENYTSTSSGLIVPAVPEIYRVKALTTALNPVAKDWELRDIQAEAQTRAVYKEFMHEGKRVFRSRKLILPASVEARKKEYALRNKKRTEAISVAQPEKKKSNKLHITRIRNENRIASILKMTEAKKSKYLPVKSTSYNAKKLSKEDAKNFARIANLATSENTVAIDVLKREELDRLSRKRRVVKVKSSQEIAQALKNSALHEKAELILRGKVKPGRRVRVGGLLIETEKDGSFCVACTVRNGKLHVPVEEVVAVSVE